MSAGRVVEADRAGRGGEIAGGILGIYPALDGMFVELDVALVEIEFFAVRDADLLLDEVDSGDFFSHGMLDLNPRVHLDEIVVTFRIDEEFDRAGVLVFRGFGGADGGLAHLLAQIGGQKRGRRLFNELLVATLHGAVAFPQVDH